MGRQEKEKQRMAEEREERKKKEEEEEKKREEEEARKKAAIANMSLHYGGYLAREKRTSQTRDKLIVKSRRNGSLKTRRPSTLTILELTDFAKKQKNCGKSFTVTKNRNTTLNRELLARNMIATNCVNVSTSTWASSTRTRAKSRSREAEVSVPLKSSNKFATCSSIIISKNLIRFH